MAADGIEAAIVSGTRVGVVTLPVIGALTAVAVVANTTRAGCAVGAWSVHAEATVAADGVAAALGYAIGSGRAFLATSETIALPRAWAVVVRTGGLVDEGRLAVAQLAVIANAIAEVAVGLANL